MKTQALLAGALLFSLTAFAQTKGTMKNGHGSEVKVVAKSNTEAQTHGTIVSTVASSKSQASVEKNTKHNESRSDRMESKEERKEAKVSQKNEQPEGRTEMKPSKQNTKSQKDLKIGGKARMGTDVKLSRPNMKVGTRVSTGARIL